MKICRSAFILIKNKYLKAFCHTSIELHQLKCRYFRAAYYFNHSEFNKTPFIKNSLFSVNGTHHGKYNSTGCKNARSFSFGLGLNPRGNSSFFARRLFSPSNSLYWYITNNFSSKTSKTGIYTGTGSHISSLKTKKRFQRKKIHVDEHSDEEFHVIAQATADEYDLEGLGEGFRKQGLYVETPIIQMTQKNDPDTDPENVLYLCAAYHVTQEPRTMYIFRDGVIVFWNVPALERQNIVRFIERFQSGEYADDVVQDETETLIYTYSDSPTRLKPSQNIIIFSDRGDKDLEKFTFSNALAMSVKLGIWEASLDSYIDSIEHVTEKLRESGVVVLSQQEVLQKMGQLFALRHLINLSSDLLDTPDFYWEHESLGHLYNRMAGHLSIHKRTSVMNTKLSHCLELMELLKSHLNERHASRLEWTIIILIMVEVFFEVLHYL